MEDFTQEECKYIMDNLIIKGEKDEDGYLHGYGYKVSESRMGILIGNFVHGILNGHSKLISYNKQNQMYMINYEGMIVNGKRSGRGWQIFNSNIDSQLTYYIGNFENDKANGYGFLKRYSDNHIIYEGHWKDYQFHGYGIYYSENGYTYDGVFINGVCNGEGTIICQKTGEIRYIGDIVNFKASGKGIYTCRGNRYIGEIDDFIAHGQGEQYIIQNEKEILIYKGGWKNDHYHGIGKLYNVDEELVFYGEFNMQIPYGKELFTELPPIKKIRLTPDIDL